jgi:membrane protease YdiL (CAAX protease family)
MLSVSSKEKSEANLGSPLRVIVTTILIFIASQAVAVLVLSLVYGMLHHHANLDFDNSVTAQFFYILIAEGLAALFAIMLVKNRGLQLSAIGLGRMPQLNDFARAALGFAAFWGLLIIAGLVINSFSPDLNDQKQNLGFTHLNNGLENTLAFISLVILPPLGEEILMRGYLYSGLRRYWNFMPALIATSLIFGIAHLEFGGGGPLVWAAGIDTFLLSIVLVYLREHTGALYSGMAVHMLNNMIAFFVVIK